jgi:hypothetical protein
LFRHLDQLKGPIADVIKRMRVDTTYSQPLSTCQIFKTTIQLSDRGGRELTDINEIKKLEDKIDKGSIRMHAPLIGMFCSLVMLPYFTAHQNDLPVVALSLPLLPMIAALVWVKRNLSWERRARRRVDDHYHMNLIDTKWMTPAGAEGIVVEVGERGYNVVLAFPNGGKETYQVRQLKPVDTRAT